MKLKLERPLVFFDLETTGIDILSDRIIELSYIKLFPDGHADGPHTLRMNPGVPIPAESTAVHHITDEMVAAEPTFEQLAPRIREIFTGADIAGFNSNKFDVPLLIEELNRINLKFDVHQRSFIDVQNIFHKKEQRTLVAAYKFYCDKDLEDAHSAAGDVRATYEVFLSQLERYDDLPEDVKSLADYSRMKNSIDLSARIVRNDSGEPVFNFGKHKGRKVKDVFKKEPSFYQWVMQGKFPKDTKDVLTTLYYEVYPPKKSASN